MQGSRKFDKEFNANGIFVTQTFNVPVDSTPTNVIPILIHVDLTRGSDIQIRCISRKIIHAGHGKLRCDSDNQKNEKESQS